MNLKETINQYRKEQKFTQSELIEIFNIGKNTDHNQEEKIAMEKGTNVYVYHKNEDIIEQYQYDSVYENNRYTIYQNPEDHCWLTKNGKRVNYTFEVKQLHLTKEAAEKERNDLMIKSKEKFLNNGIIQTLFTDWLYNNDFGVPKLDVQIMKDLIQEHYGIEVSEELHTEDEDDED